MGTRGSACSVLYCTVLYCAVLYCAVLHCAVLYCTVLYCTTATGCQPNCSYQIYRIVWSIACYGVETWTHQKVYLKYLVSYEMLCWRRMEISWTDRVRNAKMLQRVKKETNILHTVK
jgi:hypothetical protein